MKYLLLTISCLFLFSCSGPIEFEPGSMDDPAVTDPSLDASGEHSADADSVFLVSLVDIPESERSKPVIICAHGFAATTYEWWEFRQYAHSVRGDSVLTSLILLGGHGRSTDAFGESSWEDWGEPILDEYNALVDLGYTNISLAGSSTGGTLIANFLAEGKFTAVPPKYVFMVDALVVPHNKMLTAAPVAQIFVKNAPRNSNETEKRYWYTNRPISTLKELNEISSRVKNRLARGFTLPESTQAIVYKSEVDDAVDPVSAYLMYLGMKESNGDHVDVRMLDSELHVFTQLQSRESEATAADEELQLDTFQEMIDVCIASAQ